MIDELITMDTTGDGLDDSMLQFNEDGSCTVYSDYDQDGVYEQMAQMTNLDYWGNPTEVTVMIDSDNNGVYDTGFSEQYGEYGELIAHSDLNDYDQDGVIDRSRTFIDSTGDGLFDTVETMHTDNSDSPVVQTFDIEQDLTGNQTSDVTTHIEFIDSTGNGEPDVASITITDSQGQEFTYEAPYDEFVSSPTLPGYTTTSYPDYMVAGAQYDPAASDPSMVSGDPEADMEYWEYQGPTGRCAIYAQKFVIEEAIGREIPIEELVAVAEENGWFNEATGGGTASLNMDKLLEYYGVDHEMSFNNDIDSLEEALKDGKNVIVGVDSGQIWYGDDNNIFSPETNADHAVQVIGIDRTDPENPMVVLNDSGSPEGCGELVPLEVFENAWNAGDSQMIICQA